MTNQEFSNEFDVLYNNITSNLAPGLDEYEKSVFLTMALDEIVKDYFNPRTNKPQQGFDDNERRLIDFSMILKTKSYDEFSDSVFDLRENSKSVEIESDILLIVNEYINVSRNEGSVRLQVVPINYSEYSRLMSKPFKRPLKFQAWRVLDGTNKRKADLVVGPGDAITSYILRYVRRPKPIVLTDLDGLSIEGEDGTGLTLSTVSCELDPILHHEILQRAVELAKAAYTGDLLSQVALGTNSQTEIGMVTLSR